MGRRILLVSGEFIVEFAKEPGEIGRYVTVENALPEDARLVDYRIKGVLPSVIEMLLESDSWEGDSDKELAYPLFTVHYMSENKTGVLQ